MWDISDNQLIFESQYNESSETVYDLVQKIKSLLKDNTESSQALAYDHIIKLRGLVYGMCVIEPSLYKVVIYKQHNVSFYYYNIEYSNSIESYKGNPNIIEIKTKDDDRHSILYLFLTKSDYKNNIFDIVFDNTYFKYYPEMKKSVGKFIADESKKHGLAIKYSTKSFLNLS